MTAPTPKPAHRGRPCLTSEPMQRVNVSLDAETLQRAREIGEGNLSAGLRLAVNTHKGEKAHE